MSLDELMDLLAGTPTLRLLERDALRLVAFSGETRRLRPGEVLFRTGDRSDGGYVVLDGTVAVRRDGPDGERLAGPASLLGQAALFIRVQRPATAFAPEGANVLRISPTLMRRVLEAFPESAERIRLAVAADLEDFRAELDEIRRSLLALDPPSGGRPAAGA